MFSKKTNVSLKQLIAAANTGHVIPVLHIQGFVPLPTKTKTKTNVVTPPLRHRQGQLLQGFVPLPTKTKTNVVTPPLRHRQGQLLR